MRIDIVTLFPELCGSFLNASILGRAAKKGLFEEIGRASCRERV